MDTEDKEKQVNNAGVKMLVDLDAVRRNHEAQFWSDPLLLLGTLSILPAVVSA
jgi:hypothetical protein